MNAGKSNVVSKSDNQQDLHLVEKVVKCIPSAGDTKFSVKWAGYKESTLEPLENLVNCPDLIRQFLEREQAKARKALKQQNLTSADPGPRVLPISVTREIIRTKLPNEYLPSGKERRVKIRMRLAVKKVECLLVQFDGDKNDVKLVRRAVMDFMHPLHVLLFLKKEGVE
jgi:hypothetical protein